MSGHRCYHCGETVLDGSIKQIPVVSEPEPVIQKEHLSGQLHPYGSNPNTWTPRSVGGFMKTTKISKEVMHALKELGYQSSDESK